MTRVAVNGIFLNVEVTGDGPILLLLHGFTRDHRAWEPVLPCLNGYRVLRVDLIGHGRSDSPPDASRYTMARAVEDLQALLHHLNVDRFGLIGYSLGGRVALHFALAASEQMWGIVIESASPGTKDETARQARINSDEILAQSIAADGLEAFVDRWQAQALFASQSQLPTPVLDAQRCQRLENSPLGLGNSLRGMGAGTQDYLLPRLHSIHAPTLFLAGALDERYAAAAPAMAASVPKADYAIIENAGHTTHLEQPEAWASHVVPFLAKHKES